MRHHNLFVVVLIAAGVVTVIGGAWLFERSDVDSLERALGESLLQLGLIGIGGALVGLVIDLQQRSRLKVEHDAASRIASMGRLRACHVRVAYAAGLINAHDTLGTYFEQAKGLMLVRAELDEIDADLEVADRLFADTQAIRAGIAKMMHFLKRLSDEYGQNKKRLDAEYAVRGRSLSEALDDPAYYLHVIGRFRESAGEYEQIGRD